MSKSVLLVAGEKSGEEHALSFYDDLVAQCPGTTFFGVGGDDLIARGFEARYHLKDFSTMGFTEALAKLHFYWRALGDLEREVERRGTETAILIDFQGFNLALAKRLKKKGVRVLYYIAPQAWVWRPGRAKVLARTVHTLFTILPFEKEWFQSRGVKRIVPVRHPLMAKYRKQLEHSRGPAAQKFPGGRVRILLLPGSRKSEVSSLMDDFLWAVSHLSGDYDLEISLVQAKSLEGEVFAPFEHSLHHVYSEEDMAQALERADICLGASGTVTLLTALFGVPTVVTYKINLLNEVIFHLFVRYHGLVSLANIVHGRKIFPEFIQGEVNGLNILRVLKLWLTKREVYERMREQLALTAGLLDGEEESVAPYMGRVIRGETRS